MSSTPQAPPPRSIGQADGETQGQGNGLGESPSTLDTPHNTRSHSLPPMARGDEFGETELPAPFDVFGSPSMRSTPDRMQAPSSPSSMSSKSHITQVRKFKARGRGARSEAKWLMAGVEHAMALAKGLDLSTRSNVVMKTKCTSLSRSRLRDSPRALPVMYP